MAFAYSSVGLGGGSAYAALLAIFGVSYVAIPTVALSLNLVVTTVGGLSFVRRDHARARLILPFLVTSIPMAYVGGSLAVPPDAFYALLLAALVAIAARIYLWPDAALTLSLGPRARLAAALALGAALGLLAGITGIGGGIYLVPLVIILGLGTEKEAAACGAFFIWVNSASGLAARLQSHPLEPAALLPLALAGLAGGLAGSHLGAARLAPRTMQRVLGAIVLVAIVLLARRLLVL